MRFLTALTLVSVLAAVFVGVQRIEWENDYRQVTLAVTGPTYLKLTESGDDAALDLANGVVFDAGSLEAFDAFGFKALAAFEALEEKIPDHRVRSLNARGIDVIIALPSMPVVDEARLDVLRQLFDDLDVVGVLLVETQSHWTLENLEKILSLLEERDAWASTLEFFEPEGLLELYRDGHTNWVRSHIIPHRERIVLSEADALARYERAVRERSIRLLLVNEKNEAHSATETLHTLFNGLQETEYSVGNVIELPEWSLPAWTIWVISLALWTTTIWLFQRLWKRFPWVLGLIAVLAATLVVWQWGRGDDGLRFLSLSMAIIMPMCVYRGMMLLKPEQGLAFALKVFLLGTAASVVGGLVQAALMSNPAYFLKFEQFDSIKLALIEPILVIAYWELKRRGKDVWKRLWQRPLTWGDAALAVTVLGGLMFVLLRSGNDSWLPTIPFEQDLRGQLEAWLYARPRFKEFSLGHPLLIIWLAWGIWRWKEIGAIVAMVGFLGQTTIMNSFAHLHTPLTLTLLRTFNGVILGIIVGVALWEILKWLRKRQPKHKNLTVSS
jgi:hypothetical protein